MQTSNLATLAAVAALLVATPGRASHLDGQVFTFEPSTSFEGWSHTTTTAFLDGGTRLGPFVSATVSLAGMDYLAGPATPRTVYLGFDIILAGAWSGDAGDDHFIVVANGQTILDETFSNVVANTQSYPVPGSPGGTGSEAIALSAQANGFQWTFALPFQLTPQLPDCCTDVAVSFHGTGGGWYLDNVVVSSTPVPEPHTALLVASGVVALGARGRIARVRA